MLVTAAVAGDEPTLRWFAVWAKPYVGHLPNDEDSGTCALMRDARASERRLTPPDMAPRSLAGGGR